MIYEINAIIISGLRSSVVVKLLEIHVKHAGISWEEHAIMCIQDISKPKLRYHQMQCNFKKKKRKKLAILRKKRKKLVKSVLKY